MEGIIILVVGTFFVGSVCGLVAMFRLNGAKQRIDFLQDQIRTLNRELSDLSARLLGLDERIQADKLSEILTPTPEVKPSTPTPELKPSTPLPTPKVKPNISEPTTPEKPTPEKPTPKPDKPLAAQPVINRKASANAKEQIKITPPTSTTPTKTTPAQTINTTKTTAPTPPLTTLETIGQLQSKITKAVAPPAGLSSADSFEFKLGSKWGAWLGAVLILISVGLGLKAAFDSGMISPPMRIAMGALFGVAMLGGGEYLRRREWTVLFRVLTGGAIGVFYLCDFFAFEVYEIAGQTGAFAVAAGITLLGVGMAVRHNAMSIAVLAVIGGFISPVLLSTGSNRPYELFSYLFMLNLVAMGAASYRRWNALNILCFASTTILYQGWMMKYAVANDPAQLTVALIFATVFYLLFLLLPAVHSLMRGTPREMEGVSLLVGNALYSVYAYYELLILDHRNVLGFVVLGQAALIFGLRYVWRHRVGSDNRTTESLLVIGVALATLAVPIHLRVFGIPMVWALESVLLGYLGVRHNRLLLRGASVAVAALSFGALLCNLPIDPNLPLVFNTAFFAWSVAIVSFFGLGAIFHRLGSEPIDRLIGNGYNVAATFALTLGVPVHFDGYAVPMLWTTIGVIMAAASWRLDRPVLRYGSFVMTGLAVAALFANLPVDQDALRPIFNAPFGAWMWVVAALFAQGAAFNRLGTKLMDRTAGMWLNIVGLALLAIAVPVHFSGYTVPALWSALGLILAAGGWRFDRIEMRNAGAGGAMLGGLGLIQLLPMHTESFIPVMNLEFEAWMWVIGTAVAQAVIHFRYRRLLLTANTDDAAEAAPSKNIIQNTNQLIVVAAFLAYVLTCVALTLEVYFNWDLNWIDAPERLLLDGELALWTVIGGLTVWATRRWRPALATGGLGGVGAVGAEVLSVVVLGIGGLIFAQGLFEHDYPGTLLVLNVSMALKIAYVAVLIWSASVMRQFDRASWATVLETIGHVMVAVLMAVELERWQDMNHGAISATLGLALLSAAWAFQAVSLIGWGLKSQLKLRRLLGFALFGITLCKVIFLDTAELSRAMQVISFLASGVLLIVAAGIYQKFSALFQPTQPAPLEEDNA